LGLNFFVVVKVHSVTSQKFHKIAMFKALLRIKFSTYPQTISHGSEKKKINFATSWLLNGLRGAVFFFSLSSKV
jgi:hypothetical protein